MASLLLGNLSDYMEPSVACIKTPAAPAAEEARTRSEAAAAAAVVAVELKDCLACSGCITSAETVLVAQQTHQQIYRALSLDGGRRADRKKFVVISLCASSRAALAHQFGLSLEGVHRRVDYFFRHHLHADYPLLDVAFAGWLSLEVAAQHFVEAYRASGRLGGAGREGAAARGLPILSSECPGWVCFAEKKHPDLLLSRMSPASSAQQVLGALIKRGYLMRHVREHQPHLLPAGDVEIFHASIASCYDKKLEGSRGQFEDPLTGTRDVDCVITTGELLTMIEETLGSGASLASLPESPLSAGRCTASAEGSLARPFLDECAFQTWIESGDVEGGDVEGGDLGGSGVEGSSVEGSSVEGSSVEGKSIKSKSGEMRLCGVTGGSGGGYAHNVMRRALRLLCECADGAGSGCEATIKRTEHNGDYVTYEATQRCGAALSFGTVYGFRNIQTFVQRIKRDRVACDFVEVMACPGACLFGGGQPAASARAGRAALQGAYEAALQGGAVDRLMGARTAPIVAWAGGQAAAMLRTTFAALTEPSVRPAISVQW